MAKSLGRLERPATLVSRTERVLREAIVSGRFPGNRLPTAVELAEQLGVSRETVRLAQEALEREGLLVKVRRRGTLLQPPSLALKKAPTAKLLGYLQAEYPSPKGGIEAVTRATSGLMLQGALREAGRAGYQLVVRQAAHTDLDEALDDLLDGSRLGGVIFVSSGEEKQVRRVVSRGLPAVLLDHDLNLPQVGCIREDSVQASRLAVSHLAGLGHRRIAYAHWHHADLNPWRLRGYREGLRAAGLTPRRAWELPAEITPAGADRLVESVLALDPRPTALVCFNNSLAQMAVERFRERGLRVPQDVSVFGGGGEEIPGLTCHQADWHGMGAEAVRMLLRSMRGHGAPEHRVLPYVLKKGRTTSPC
jgi:LacI family transcriptional regulator